METLINREQYGKFYHRIGVIYQRPEIKASLEVILSVFMITILILVAIRPTVVNLAALQKKIVDTESVGVKADKKIAQLFSAQEQLSTNIQYISLFDNAVPSKFSYLEMVGRIESVARSTGVAVELVTIPGTNLAGSGKPVGDWSSKVIKKEASGMIVTPVEFLVTGKPNEVKNFLGEVEKVDRLAVLKSVNLVKEKRGGVGGERIKASGQIIFYVYPPKQ